MVPVKQCIVAIHVKVLQIGPLAKRRGQRRSVRVAWPLGPFEGLLLVFQ